MAAGVTGLALLATSLPEAAHAESKVTLRPATGAAGARVTLVGRDLGARDRVTVRMGKQVVARTRTGRRGTFRASFAVPARAPGRWRIVSRSRGRRIVNVFRMVDTAPGVQRVGEVAARSGRRVRWTPGEGPAGSVMQVEGARFPPRRRVRIRVGGANVARARTGRRGRFSARVTIPGLRTGRRLVRVKVGSRALGFMFAVTPAGGVAGGGSSAGGGAGGPGGPDGSGPHVIAAAGDIACDPGFSGFNNGNGSASRCRQKATSDLVVNAGLSAVLALGDIQYECASASAFAASYHPSWGRVKPITRPAPGNHEYRTTGGSGCGANAAGYFGYFGAAAGEPGKGYYSYNIGAWHLIALNSNCSTVGCSASSAQVRWLHRDLAAHPAQCTLAYWHHPRFTSGTNSPGSNSVTPLYQALYDHGADVVLVGHDHHYERFAPQTAAGGRDVARGIREFLVGTGGRGFHPLNTPRPNSEVRNNTTFGVLKLTLHAASYDWQFVPVAGGTFTDSGSQACH